MSKRRKASAKNKTIAYIAAILIHVVIIAAMLVNFSTKHKKVEAVDAEQIADTIQATTIDESQIQKQQNKLKAAERERQRKKELERQRLEKLKREAELEKKKIKDLQDKQKLEQEKAVELERQRKEIALKKKQDEEKRKKEEAERKKKEEEARKRKLAEQKRREEQERIEREKRELESQRLLEESLAAEEAFLAEQRAKQRATTLLGKYTALIKQKVSRYRTISPDFESWRVTKVNVKLSPSGEVKSARVIKSSGNVRYDRSVETAIYQASPLPIPSFVEDPEVNKLFQDLNISFDMKGL